MDGAYDWFKEENGAPKQLVSMWGAPPTVGYLLVRPGATDKAILNVHAELKRRSSDMGATMLSSVQAWQLSFTPSKLLQAKSTYMVQSTQDIVLVGRNGVIDPRFWDGRFHSSSMVYLQYRPRRRLREKMDLRAFFMNDVHIE